MEVEAKAADSGQLIAVLTREARLADFRMGNGALSWFRFLQVSPDNCGNVVHLSHTIRAKPGFSCRQKHVSGAKFMDRRGERNDQNRCCPLMPVPRTQRNDNRRPPNFLLSMKARPPDFSALQKSLCYRHCTAFASCDSANLLQARRRAYVRDAIIQPRDCWCDPASCAAATGYCDYDGIAGADRLAVEVAGTALGESCV